MELSGRFEPRIAPIPGPLRESIGRRCETEGLPKAAADAPRVQPVCVGPCFQAKHGLAAYVPCEQVGPVSWLLGFSRQICQQVREGRALVPFRQANKGVGVRDPPCHAPLCIIRERQHQHLGASPIKPVQMTFPSLVQQNVAGFHRVSSCIASFRVSSGQHYRCEAARVNVTHELLPRWVSRAFGSRRTAPAAPR